jgi:5'-nucleotidase
MRLTRGSRPSQSRPALIPDPPLAAILAASATVLGLAPPGAAASTPEPLCGTGPLEILLTNDDGYEAVGIRALADALVQAGHRVTLAAPVRNASGSGMSFTWGDIGVRQVSASPAAFAVDASPATAVVLAATALYPDGRHPDLVVSGINHGPNDGALLALSGTIGAALAGTLLLDPPIPGMAVNVGRLNPAEPWDSDAHRGQFTAAAAHFTRVLGASRGWFCESGHVIRPRSVLNVNYPALPRDQWRGTIVSGQDTASDLHVVFEPKGEPRGEAEGETRYAARMVRSEPPAARGSDRDGLARGYVTVTPIGAALAGVQAPTAAPTRSLTRRLRDL